MSAIYFHTRNHGTHRVEGRERAHLGLLTENLANALIGATRLFPDANTPTPYGYGQQPHSSEMLDRITALGSDVLNLACRVHGTCEIWGWVAAANCDWLAQLIGQSLAAGVFRPNMGWQTLQQWLRRPGIGDVVMSYSVTESFPSMHLYLAGVSVWPGTDEPGWYAMSQDEQWDYAHAWQIAQGEALDMDVEMKPDNWRSWRFGSRTPPMLVPPPTFEQAWLQRWKGAEDTPLNRAMMQRELDEHNAALRRLLWP